MKENSILNAIRDSYIKHGLDTERMVFSMLMSKVVCNKIDIENFNLGNLFKMVHEVSMSNTCVNFSEGELVFQDNYEIHSVSASRDEDGDPEVYIHMLDINSMETHSVRVYQFPQLDWLLQIIEVVNDKCRPAIKNEEDED